MKRNNWTVIGLFISIFLLIPVMVSAEALSVTPLSWDFGNIELGMSRSQIFTLTSLGPTGVWVYIADIVPTEFSSGWPTQVCARADLVPPGCCDPLPPCEGCEPFCEYIACDLAITQLITRDGSGWLPTELPTGWSIDVEITFTPSALGNRQGFLYIYSNSSGEGVVPRFFIPLTGWVVDAANPSGELMGGLLTFFDTSIDYGFLIGIGSGDSAAGRLKAFGNMLVASSDLIEAHEYGLACTQLQDALNRTDGLEPPPDFVDGEKSAELATRIDAVMDALACP